MSTQRSLPSLLLALTKPNSILKEKYFPPIELDKNCQYVCGLVNFETYNTIPNVDIYNNQFHFIKTEKRMEKGQPIVITLTRGLYNVNDICQTITTLFEKSDINISISFDSENLKFKLKCNKTIDFTQAESVGYIFGFNNRLLMANQEHLSDTVVQVSSGKIYTEVFSIYINSETRNKFHIENLLEKSVKKVHTIEIPVGVYEIKDIRDFITKVIDKDITFELNVNKSTMKCEMVCTVDVDFTQPNTIGELLGFSKRILSCNKTHISDQIVDIIRINSILIECNIVSGSYINGKQSHTLFQFYPKVQSGYKLAISPKTIIFLPVTVESIHELEIRVVDQENRLVNFQGEEISVQIFIKKL